MSGCNSDSINVVDISDVYSAGKLNKQERSTAFSTAKEMLPAISVQGISNSSVPGLYELRTDRGVIYATHDFKKIIRGELFDVTTSTNETQMARVLSRVELKINQAANQTVEQLLLDSDSSTAPLEAKAKAVEKNTVNRYYLTEQHQGIRKPDGTPEGNLKSSKESSMDAEMKAVQEALAKKILASQSLSEEKQSSAEPKAENVDIRFNMDGRVDPDQIENQRKFIIYKGNKIPKLDFNAKGERVSADQKRNKVRGIVNKVVKADDSWSFSYKAENERASIVVFTDPGCPFCKKLHAEIPKLNELGISVYNLFYPRQLGSGLKGNPKAEMTLKQMDKIWFAENRNKAANDIYEGYTPNSKIDTTGKTPNPVFEHYLLGEITGMRGTPHILLSNGKTLRGYYKAEDINKYL